MFAWHWWGCIPSQSLGWFWVRAVLMWIVNIFSLLILLLVYYLNMIITIHDDVIKWKHFPRYWPFVQGIHRSPVNSSHKGQWRGALIFSFISTSINGRINNRKAGDLRRNRVHYDVTVMYWDAYVHGHSCWTTDVGFFKATCLGFCNFSPPQDIFHLVLLLESSLQWRYNGRDDVSNHQRFDCLLNRLFRCRSKKTSRLVWDFSNPDAIFFSPEPSVFLHEDDVLI